jgi:hypothetical protein
MENRQNQISHYILAFLNRAVICPEIGLKSHNSCFRIWGHFQGADLLSTLLYALAFQAGQAQPQRFKEKLYLHPDSTEPYGSPSFNTTKILK